MMTLPANFDVSLLVSDFTSLALPFVSVAVLIATGSLIIRMIKKGKP